jgi:hypothetical protein
MRMLVLYSSGGAQDFELLGPTLDEATQQKLIEAAYRMLKTRGEEEAASFLAALDFSLSDAVNGFQDEFCVLHATTDIGTYERLRIVSDKKEFRYSCEKLASTISELHAFVRFIVLHVDINLPAVVDDEIVGFNQAKFTFKDSNKIEHDGLHFRSKTEIRIYEALVKRGLLVFPLPVAVMGRKSYLKEPDFVVSYKGRIGILEIHGDKWHPPETAAKEHERRREFAKLGVNVYEIFGADRCLRDPESVVNDFLLAFARSA